MMFSCVKKNNKNNVSIMVPIILESNKKTQCLGSRSPKPDCLKDIYWAVELDKQEAHLIDFKRPKTKAGSLMVELETQNRVVLAS